MRRLNPLFDRLKDAAYAAQVLPLACILVMATIPPALAHDCSGPDDCKALPPNVDIGTGIAAGAAGGAAGWVYIRRRRKERAKPCDELRKEVDQGAARIKALETQTAALQSELDNLPPGTLDQPITKPPTYIA